MSGLISSLCEIPRYCDFFFEANVKFLIKSLPLRFFRQLRKPSRGGPKEFAMPSLCFHQGEVKLGAATLLRIPLESQEVVLLSLKINLLLFFKVYLFIISPNVGLDLMSLKSRVTCSSN